MPPWSYTINCYTQRVGATLGWGQYDSRQHDYGVPIAAYPNPSAVIYLVDENKLAADGIQVNDPAFVNVDRATNRHDGRANVFYLDSHMGTVPGGGRSMTRRNGLTGRICSSARRLWTESARGGRNWRARRGTHQGGYLLTPRRNKSRRSEW